MNQEKIGTFISECRKQKGFTQEQVAEILGVSNRTISKWENGNCMPDYSILPLLAQTLDITINELLSGEKISQEDYQRKLEENLIINIGELKKRTKITILWMIKIVILIVGFFLLTQVLEHVSKYYSYYRTYLNEQEINVSVCSKNDIISITIEAKDGKPMLMDIKFNPKTMNYTYNPYHIKKGSYIENYPSKYIYDVKYSDNAQAIIIANQIIYKKEQNLNQCQN